MTTVLPLDELERMRRSVRPAEYHDVKGRRKAELKKLSQDRLQHWPNTLEAARLKKESYLAEKAQREEEARQEVDKIVRAIVLLAKHRALCPFERKILDLLLTPNLPPPHHVTFHPTPCRKRSIAVCSDSRPSSAPTT